MFTLLPLQQSGQLGMSDHPAQGPVEQQLLEGAIELPGQQGQAAEEA
ncbi:MAG: hypothetical protein GF399_05035 [Candidatus Coatesbacteria bacterium]|nr:hypothetical protein [Candidatus Coatesbacteria bacterium]